MGFHDMSLMYMDGKNTLTMITSEPVGQMELVVGWCVWSNRLAMKK